MTKKKATKKQHLKTKMNENIKMAGSTFVAFNL